VVNGVECGREIEKDKSGNLLLIEGIQEIILDAKESRFCGMETAVC
jgi:hypothetical protein